MNGRVTETSPRSATDQTVADMTAAEVLQDVRGAAAPEAVAPFTWTGAVVLSTLALWALARRWRRRPPAARAGAARDRRADLMRLAEDHRRGRLTPDQTVMALDALLRTALAETLGLPTASLTSRELRACAELPASASPPLAELMALCDAVKFGRMRPAVEQVTQALQSAGEVLLAVAPAAPPPLAGGAGLPAATGVKA